MQRQLITLSFGVGALLLATTHAYSQTPRNCGQRDAVIERLASAYGETRQSIGLGGNNRVMEVFASTETGTWTITITLPDGMMCMVASGQSFENIAQTAPSVSGTAL